MTAVDVDALAKLREGLALWLEARGEPIRQTEPARHWLPVADAFIAGPLAPLIAEVRRGRALREAAEGLCDSTENQWPDFDRSGDPLPYVVTTTELRAALAAVDAS